MNDLPSTRLEIDLQALEHNFYYFQGILKQKQNNSRCKSQCLWDRCGSCCKTHRN